MAERRSLRSARRGSPRCRARCRRRPRSAALRPGSGARPARGAGCASLRGPGRSGGVPQPAGVPQPEVDPPPVRALIGWSGSGTRGSAAGCQPSPAAPGAVRRHRRAGRAATQPPGRRRRRAAAPRAHVGEHGASWRCPSCELALWVSTGHGCQTIHRHTPRSHRHNPQENGTPTLIDLAGDPQTVIHPRTGLTSHQSTVPRGASFRSSTRAAGGESRRLRPAVAAMTSGRHTTASLWQRNPSGRSRLVEPRRKNRSRTWFPLSPASLRPRPILTDADGCPQPTLIAAGDAAAA